MNIDSSRIRKFENMNTIQRALNDFQQLITNSEFGTLILSGRVVMTYLFNHSETQKAIFDLDHHVYTILNIIMSLPSHHNLVIYTLLEPLSARISVIWRCWMKFFTSDKLGKNMKTFL